MNFIHVYYADNVLLLKNLIVTLYLKKVKNILNQSKQEQQNMKILLQPEARNISDCELKKNQQYLIDLINKIRNFAFNFHQQKNSENKQKSTRVIPDSKLR